MRTEMTKTETMLQDLRVAWRSFAKRERQDDFAIRSAEACADLGRRLSTHGNLTEAQWRYAEKLVAWAKPRAAAAPQTSGLASGVKRVFDLFTRAKSAGLRFPKIRLETADGQKVVLSQAGERSKYLGQVIVTDGGPFGANKFFGRIDAAGTLTNGSAMTDSVRALVDALAAKPEEVASIYGRRTGSCCFCGRGLEDGRSVAVGYGPICAEKFGLPWGEERVGAVRVTLDDVAQAAALERREAAEEAAEIQKREAAEERRRMDRKFGASEPFPAEAGDLDDVAAFRPISVYEHCRQESGLSGRALDDYVRRGYGHN